MEIYVLIKMFQGIHDGVELFRNEKASERAYKKYTGQKYPADGNFENIHEDFRDTIIQVVHTKERVFIAMYNPCIHESEFGIVSLHYTRKGANFALEKKKKEEKRNWTDGVKPDWVRFKVTEKKVR